jgi:hypothetical protein
MVRNIQIYKLTGSQQNRRIRDRRNDHLMGIQVSIDFGSKFVGNQPFRGPGQFGTLICPSGLENAKPVHEPTIMCKFLIMIPECKCAKQNFTLCLRVSE